MYLSCATSLRSMTFLGNEVAGRDSKTMPRRWTRIAQRERLLFTRPQSSIMVFLIVRIEGIEGTAKPLIGLLTLLRVATCAVQRRRKKRFHCRVGCRVSRVCVCAAHSRAMSPKSAKILYLCLPTHIYYIALHSKYF